MSIATARLDTYRACVSGWACAACSATNVAGTRFCGYCGVRRVQHTVSDEELAAALVALPANAATARVQAGADAVEERRVVTSLFADVSGFTTLADMLEPEELHEVIAPVISGLAEIAERYEGFIAKYAGDALLVFFGAPISHEDDPERAVRVALEMHAALPSFVTQLPEGAKDLTLHIGINTGRVVAGRFGGDERSDYSILGDAVIVAQRLESVAGSGDTFVGESTYELTKDHFRYESLGEMQLKGKLRAVKAWRLLGERRSVAISGEGLDRPAYPLVGRSEELATIWAVLDRLATGRSGTVTICSEPGVGKSRLLREVREQASDMGVRWYQGRSVSYGSAVAYHPWTDLIRQVTHARAEDDTASASARLDVALEGAEPARAPFGVLLGLDTEGETPHPEAFRQAMRRGAAAWLRSLSSKGPIVLSFEDVHWSDGPSIDLIADLQAALADRPILFLLTSRPEGAGRLGAVRSRATLATAIDLQPLEASAVRELVALVLGGTPPIELLATATERSGGNPLFVGEIVRALQERGDVVHTAGRWRMRSGWDGTDVPDSVERVLASRIDLLPAAETNVIQLAAVVGRVVPLRLANRLVEQIDGGESALEQLVARRLLDRTVWVGDPAVMFSHALVQEVAYSRLLKRHRTELHRRVAASIEQEWGTGDDVVDLLARHLYLGEAGEQAMHALVRAGNRARDLYANDEAVLHLRRARELAQRLGSPSGNAILLDLAAAEETAGHLEEALALYEDAARTDRVAAATGLSAVLRKRGDYDAAATVIDDVLAAPVDDRTRARLLLERAWALGGGDRGAEVVTTLREALELVPERSELRAEILLALARQEEGEGRASAAVPLVTEALEHFQAEGELRRVVKAMRILGGAHATNGEYGVASGVLRRAIELAHRVGDPEEAGASLLNLGHCLHNVGDIDEATDANTRALEIFESVGHGGGRLFALNNLAANLLETGRIDECIARCTECIDAAREASYLVLEAEALDTLVQAHVAAEQPGAAFDAAARAADAFRRLGNEERAAALLDMAGANA